MPRLLSPALTQSKNLIDGGSPWVWLFQLDIPGAPGAFRLANYDQDILFHGQAFLRFPLEVEAVEEPTSLALVHLRVRAANVDQQIQSLLENYWAPLAYPQWQVTIYQIDATMPDETPLFGGDLFDVQSVQTDLLTATFDLVAAGVTLGAVVPKRRYTVSNGYYYIPRR